MATTPQSVPETSGRPLGTQPTYEEFCEALRLVREQIRQFAPADWDPVKELIEERRLAALAGE